MVLESSELRPSRKKKPSEGIVGLSSPRIGVAADSRATDPRFFVSVPAAAGERRRAKHVIVEFRPQQQRSVEVGSLSADFNATIRPIASGSSVFGGSFFVFFLCCLWKSAEPLPTSQSHRPKLVLLPTFAPFQYFNAMLVFLSVKYDVLLIS